MTGEILTKAVQDVLDSENAPPRLVGTILLAFTYHEEGEDRMAFDSVGGDVTVLGLTAWVQNKLLKSMTEDDE